MITFQQTLQPKAHSISSLKSLIPKVSPNIEAKMTCNQVNHTLNSERYWSNCDDGGGAALSVSQSFRAALLSFISTV